MCCQVTNLPVGYFVLIEVNVIVDDFFTVYLIQKSDQLLLQIHLLLSYIN